MKRPVVAIVGRPNVGKSTFFNRVCGRKISIVKDMPGVTRDRIYGDAEWCGYAFSLVDTGGLDFASKDELNANIKMQAQIAIDLAEVIVFMVDGKEGITNQDYEVADFLRKSGKPIVLGVNKLDNNEIERSFDFYSLNLGNPFVISSEHGKGVGDLLDEVVSLLKTQVNVDDLEDRLKIAIVGKPNAGKSSITNRLLGKNRMVVSNVAGTTRDAIDIPFHYDGKEYILIDTAGMRKKSQIDKDTIESYSVLRSIESVRRADVVIFVVDASVGLTEQDQKISAFISEEGKPCVFVFNKWDLVDKSKHSIQSFEKTMEIDFPFISYVKPLYLSAETGQRLSSLMPAVLKTYENASKKISMGVLNEVIGDALGSFPPPAVGGRRLKIVYCSQIGTNPPKIMFFCNDASLVPSTYERYLENKIRQAFDFEGTPIKLIFKNNFDKE